MFDSLLNREKVYCPYCLESTGSLQPVVLVTVGGKIVKNEKGDHVHACTKCDEEVPFFYRITSEYLTLILFVAMGEEKIMAAAKDFRQLLEHTDANKEQAAEELKDRIRKGTQQPGEVLMAMMTGNMPKDLPKKDKPDTEEYEQEGIFWKKKEPEA